MSDFDFIHETALRANINQAHELVLELVLLSVSENYKQRKSLVSSLRKNTIIHIAAIVEALLLWKLKQKCDLSEIELEDEWEYKDPHIIHSLIEKKEDLVWCKRKKVKKRIDKIDFLHLIRVLEKYKLVTRKKLISDIDQIRIYRNNLHIGGLKEIEKEYKTDDVDYCFSVLEQVKKVIQK